MAFSDEIASTLVQAPLHAFDGEIASTLAQAPMHAFSVEDATSLVQLPPNFFSGEIATALLSNPLHAFADEISAPLYSDPLHSFSDEFGAEISPFLNNIRLLRVDQVRGSLIAVRRSVNMNTTGDTPITVVPKKYTIRRVIVTNASVPLTAAVGGIYTGPGKTGTALVPAGQSYVALATPRRFIDTGQDISTITDAFTAQTLYLSLTTPQGVAATADVYIYGDSVEP